LAVIAKEETSRRRKLNLIRKGNPIDRDERAIVNFYESIELSAETEVLTQKNVDRSCC